MRRTALLALLLGLLVLVVGTVVIVNTFPSDDKIEKISFEELGIDPAFAKNPFVEQIIDTFMRPVQERVRHRVVEEARTSMLLGAGAMLVITVGGVLFISADSHRRRLAKLEKRTSFDQGRAEQT